ncbi:type-F conjugative transfer system secretin TraK [Massilia sp. CT11-137]|uniref:TraK domain-containing protein n=1 Tax=Massilia sp. CT11-137 TaxID=3393901 RepID=UPI0039A69D07
MPISLLLLGAAAIPAQAQQTASATFAPVPVRTTASAEFPVRKVKATLKTPAAPKADRLAVHPDAAIKDTRAPEVVLPGVMKIAGADAHALDFTRARIVEVTNGGSQTVYVSVSDQNRIQLPWPNTKVVGTEELMVDKRPTSNNVYVQFKEGVKRAVQVYFEQPDGPSVLGLQLVPKDIPAQTILVRDASLQSGERRPVKGGDYVAAIQGVMEDVALGAAPQGYSQSDIAAGPIALNGLVVTPQRMYSSADKDIYVYDVANPGPNRAALQEKEFDGENVLAISIFPRPVIAPSEHTRVIVLTRKASGG